MGFINLNRDKFFSLQNPIEVAAVVGDIQGADFPTVNDIPEALLYPGKYIYYVNESEGVEILYITQKTSETGDDGPNNRLKKILENGEFSIDPNRLKRIIYDDNLNAYQIYDN